MIISKVLHANILHDTVFFRMWCRNRLSEWASSSPHSCFCISSSSRYEDGAGFSALFLLFFNFGREEVCDVWTHCSSSSLTVMTARQIAAYSETWRSNWCLLIKCRLLKCFCWAANWCQQLSFGSSSVAVLVCVCSSHDVKNRQDSY